MDQVRETYDMELDAKYAAARGFVDAVIIPEEHAGCFGAFAAHQLELQRPAYWAVCFAANVGLSKNRQLKKFRVQASACRSRKATT